MLRSARLAVVAFAMSPAIGLVAFAGCGSSSSDDGAPSKVVDGSLVQMSSDAAASGGAVARESDDGSANSDASDAGEGGMSCPGAIAELDAAIGFGKCGQCVRKKCVEFTGSCQEDCACVAALTTIFTCFDLMGNAGVCEQSLSGVPASLQNEAFTCDFNCESACDPAYMAPDAGVDAGDAGDAADDDASDAASD